jgi:signal transduction histidine kinase
VSRFRFLASRYGFDALIAIAAIESALEVARRHDSLGAPRTTLWFAVPAVALVVLPLLGRRRFPFAAPASVWLIGAALSFADGRLVVFTHSVFVAGMAAALLLGNLRDAVQARLGLAVVLACAVIVYNDPNHGPGELIFIPVLFGIGWLAGFAVRERSTQAEAAEVRAIHAERERDAAARIAVAEERARIAREPHDIVAHAVSVMVLQVGAVRHKLPQTLAEDKDALRASSRPAVQRLRRCAASSARCATTAKTWN